jgi:hypothetical protein
VNIDPDQVADAYVRFMETGDRALLGLMSDEFLDHVSGQRGPKIWETVLGWLEESFADRVVEHHGTATTSDGRILVWATVTGRHVGSAFPWLGARPPSGRKVAWKQVHIFRGEAGRIVEHWAVRDDLRVLEAIDASD